MTYTAAERRRAAAWKSASQSLPDAAKAPAPYRGKQGCDGATAYAFCLPAEWHAGTAAGPSNHLLSSQVQCVNALGQMVTDPARVQRAFGSLLDTEQVLEVEPGRFLTFEYLGPVDFFGEAAGGARVRGAHCTSVDAAFLHRRRDGLRELVLLEWKYTEKYALRRPDPAKDAVRWERYGSAWSAADSPVRSDVLPFALVLDEPFYQLVRQQLLAHELEKAHALGADRVRVLHVAPDGNDAYQSSLVRPEHRDAGSSVGAVWQRMLRRPDRFLSLDSSRFLDPAVTSPEYATRYGGAA